MKSLIHQRHLGIENCKKSARQSLTNVLLAELFETANLESQLLIKPNQAWTKIAADPFCLCGHYYLLISDYYSKFIVTETLKNLQSSTVINKCKKIFSQFGTTKELVTDNL